MIKKKFEDNNNSFELNCVKVEIKQIKKELVNLASTLHCFSWIISYENFILFYIKYSQTNAK